MTPGAFCVNPRNGVRVLAATVAFVVTSPLPMSSASARAAQRFHCLDVGTPWLLLIHRGRGYGAGRRLRPNGSVLARRRLLALGLRLLLGLAASASAVGGTGPVIFSAVPVTVPTVAALVTLAFHLWPATFSEQPVGGVREPDARTRVVLPPRML